MLLLRCHGAIPFDFFIDDLLDGKEGPISKVTYILQVRELLLAWRVELLFKGTLTRWRSRLTGTSASLKMSNANSCTQERITPHNAASRESTEQGIILQKRTHTSCQPIN